MTAPLAIDLAHRAINPAFWQALAHVFGERLSRTQAVCEQHGRDESAYPPTPPQGVVFAQSTADVVQALQVAQTYRAPVIAFGAGTSLEGHLLAVQGGLCLDLSRMNRVLQVFEADMQVRVQAGVTRKQVNEAVKHLGLFFPIDPGADASIGGMCATRASGTNAVRYGTMLDNVLGLTVVTASGDVLHCGGRARKSSAGYDLTRLFIGSEGTLGVITEITLKLHPLPQAIRAAVCNFDDVAQAVASVIAIIQCGIPIARCELMDTATVRAVNRHSKLNLRESPMLLFEFHAAPAALHEQVLSVEEITREHGAAGFVWADTPEQRNQLWSARHQAYFALLQSRPGCRAITTDVCVPISRLADCVAFAQQGLARCGLPGGILGHVGDGNFHVAILVQPDDANEVASAEAFNQQLVAQALALDGTCTGEHGIGLHKREFLRQEAGDPAIAAMRALKHALDPHDILNPGKILPNLAG